VPKLKDLTIDKTELVLIDRSNRKKVTVQNITYEHIMRIQFTPYEARTLFKKVPSEKIEIFTNKRPEPFIVPKVKNEADFDRWKEKLEEFAKRHFLTFQDSTT
jgi:hypothetical protein